MPVVLTDRVKIADEILSCRAGDETVILNLRTGRYYALDPVGTRFFELLQSTDDLGEIHRQLLCEFEVTAGRLAADLLALSEDMHGKGILVIPKP